MLIAHSMPAVSGVALSGGAGAAWLTSDGHAALFDGKPARKARLQWRNDATPVTTHSVTLAVTFAAAIVPRVVCLLGLSCGAGVKVEVRGAGAVALGGNAVTQRTVLLPDGTVGLWIVTDGAASVDGLEVAIFNDQNGATWATSSTALDIGELGAFKAADLPAQLDLQDALEDGTQFGATLAMQPAHVPRAARRRVTCAVNLTNTAGTYTATDSLAALRTSLRGGAKAALVPMPRAPQAGMTGPLDVALIHAQAVFGYAATGAIAYVAGSLGFWTMPIEIIEAPAA
jgi:hypothetical protein